MTHIIATRSAFIVPSIASYSRQTVKMATGNRDDRYARNEREA
jgi:hypothetical protein